MTIPAEIDHNRTENENKVGMGAGLNWETTEIIQTRHEAGLDQSSSSGDKTK